MDMIEFWMGYCFGGVSVGLLAWYLLAHYRRGVEAATTSFFKSLEADHKEFMDWRTANGRY